ncbi:MAG: cytochrome ubiquinol oxidase subunit I [Micrococcaceae bacterium]
MDPLEIARLQFGVLTVYHFFMVPLTIGLGLVVASLQTAWYRTGKEEYLRMTKFWGKLFLINIIMGVVTGIVQEFQFGLAWSEYSRYVGDVFGAPLAMEALIAFFLESTFVGLWLFGWDRLSKKIHLVTIWCTAIGSSLSAYFILAANSFMQHPTGVKYNNGRAEMASIVQVLTSPTAVNAFIHVLLGAFAVAGSFLFGIAWYKLYQRRKDGIDDVDAEGNVIVGEDGTRNRDKTDHKVWFKSLKIGSIIAVVSFVLLGASGDSQARLLFHEQPIKMASAEALCDTKGPAPFSVVAIGSFSNPDDCSKVHALEVPHVLSLLLTHTLNGEVKGLNDLIPEYQAKYGTNYPNNPAIYGQHAGKPINYSPPLPIVFWGFRLMIGLAALSTLIAALGFWFARKGTVPLSKGFNIVAISSIFMPFLANSAGWIFTEMGRQPFVVVPNLDATGAEAQVHMFTAAAVSNTMTAGEVLFSLISLAAVYGVLAVFEVKLLVKYINGGVAASMPEIEDYGKEKSDEDKSDSDNDVLAFAY